MKGRLCTAMTLTGLLLCAPAVGRPSLDAARLEQLSRYDVLQFADPAGPAAAGLLRYKAIGVFDATPDEIFQVVKGYDRYREYVPRIVASQTVWQAGGQAMVMLQADLPWPLQDVWVYARFTHDGPVDASYKIRFSLVRGNLHRYEGMFFIEPFDDGRSAVTYELLAQTDSRVPRAVMHAAMSKGVSLFVHCLRSRVNLLAQKQKEKKEPAPADDGSEPSVPGALPAAPRVAEEPATSEPRPAT